MTIVTPPMKRADDPSRYQCPDRIAAAGQATPSLDATNRRRRSLRTDSVIAATAILAEVELASYNAPDFAPFTAYGLKLLAL